jgi:hypothetical protein
MNDKHAKIEMVTLKQLCTELKVDRAIENWLFAPIGADVE